jgi:hypothetical protein
VLTAIAPRNAMNAEAAQSCQGETVKRKPLDWSV